jgi:hypothetical protein
LLCIASRMHSFTEPCLYPEKRLVQPCWLGCLQYGMEDIGYARWMRIDKAEESRRKLYFNLGCILLGRLRSKCSVRVYEWFLICRLRAGL